MRHNSSDQKADSDTRGRDTHEGAKNLRKDIMRHFLPWESFPDRKADSDSRIEMPTTSGSTGNDCERDTNSKRPTNLEQTAEDRDPNLRGDWVCGGQGERSDRGNTRKDVKEDAGGFGHHLTQNPGPLVLEVEPPLRDGLGRYDMARDMALKNVRDTKFDIVGVLADQVVVWSRHDVPIGKVEPVVLGKLGL